jgi:hypothetical protein
MKLEGGRQIPARRLISGREDDAIGLDLRSVVAMEDHAACPLIEADDFMTRRQRSAPAQRSAQQSQRQRHRIDAERIVREQRGARWQTEPFGQCGGLQRRRAQPGGAAQVRLLQQPRFVEQGAGKIKLGPRPPAAVERLIGDQIVQRLHRTMDAPPHARGIVRPDPCRKLCERDIGGPQDERCRCRRAALRRRAAIDQRDLEAVAGQPLGEHRAHDARADDRNIDAFGQSERRQFIGRGILPAWVPAAQVQPLRQFQRTNLSSGTTGACRRPVVLQMEGTRR